MTNEEALNRMSGYQVLRAAAHDELLTKEQVLAALRAEWAESTDRREAKVVERIAGRLNLAFPLNPEGITPSWDGDVPT